VQLLTEWLADHGEGVDELGSAANPMWKNGASQGNLVCLVKGRSPPQFTAAANSGTNSIEGAVVERQGVAPWSLALSASAGLPRRSRRYLARQG
jgi:hypothetical protein